LFAEEGARLALCSRTNEELGRVISSIKAHGGAVAGCVTDISSIRQTRRLIQFTLSRYGQIDLVINNAGILGPRVPIAEYPLHDWGKVLQINLTGTFYVSREAAAVMARQQHGCIITLSSSVGRAGRARWGAYAVSKFGVEGLSQVLADELRPAGVCVMTLNPGATRTKMRAEAYPTEDPLKLRNPSAAAQALLRLATRCSPALSGQAFDLDHLP
jgi:NAD(P)-dependent dehydrogenase (short-subunit alcohol dehydrogenase family)